MKIHADLSLPAVVNSAELPWIDSPMPGVQRRMLERDGGEVARATSIVRYAPDSYFDFHTHDAGEEFLVLEGVFSDEMGDFPSGWYVRNPPGSKHKPHTREGCTILVKLRQFDPDDREFVRIDTNQAQWQREASGIDYLPLHRFAGEEVRLQRWEAGTASSEQLYPGGKEIYLISGSFSDRFGEHPAGTWMRLPANTSHRMQSAEGCLLYVKTGHLD